MVKLNKPLNLSLEYSLRIESFLGLRGNNNIYGCNQYDRVADVLCDLQHFCKQNNIRFWDEFELASEVYKEEQLLSQLLSPINSLKGWSKRASNVCEKINIKTIKDLIQLTEVELLRVKGCGKRTLNEIKEHLASESLSLGMQQISSWSSSQQQEIQTWQLPQHILPRYFR